MRQILIPLTGDTQNGFSKPRPPTKQDVTQGRCWYYLLQVLQLYTINI